MLRLQDLQPGRRVRLNDGIRYVCVHSRVYICPKCRIFCLELVPTVTRAVIERAKRRRTPIQTKVFCKNGCHLDSNWGWNLFDWGSIRQRNQIREWPEDWRKDDARSIEKKIREAGGK